MELYPQVTTIVVILVGELIAIVMLPHSRREVLSSMELYPQVTTIVVILVGRAESS